MGNRPDSGIGQAQSVAQEATMQDENIVRDLYVSDGSRAMKASYFVEGGILHASVDGPRPLPPSTPA